MAHFTTFDLLPPIQKALDSIGFKIPTPIQEKSIPVIFTGKDLIGSAQTGTGKTGAFCIPTLTNLINHPAKNALILVPTRELALQIEEFWLKLTMNCKEIRCVTLIGGVSMEPQMRGIKKGPRLIIATPGRLVDHLQRRSLSLNNIGILILDEADRMLDMGFAPQLNEIVRVVPKNRQTLFFSATWDSKTDLLSKKFLRETAMRVSAGETSKAATTVSQTLLSTTQAGKRDLLLEELNSKEGTILVFARTQHGTDRISRYLASYGVSVNRLHGGRTQGQRSTALREFREGKIRVLVATDIAARGIDVAEIAHVINFDLPQVAEDYIHRIGRTGRAGATGTATSFVTNEDIELWREIAKLLKKTGSPVPNPIQRKQARPANIEDVEAEVFVPGKPAPRFSERRTDRVISKPLRKPNRRDNQWHDGTIQVREGAMKPRPAAPVRTANSGTGVFITRGNQS
jgi:ATP-dependent RNA helicase DeaD